MLELKKNAAIIMPCVKKIFRVRFTRHTDYNFIFTHVVNNESLSNSFCQRVLDAGYKRIEANEILNRMKELCQSYDLDDPQIIRIFSASQAHSQDYARASGVSTSQLVMD